jgi:NAD(P)H-dependent flavin oxidoreductase YrpB (nitropropane dioxygenase family)
VQNRPGNVNDSTGAADFLRVLLRDLRERFGRSLPLALRLDGGFFYPQVLRLLVGEELRFAIKVPLWKWLGIRERIAAVNALGPPPAYVIERADAKGVWVGALAGTREHAIKQVEQGVDLIVAQGTEAGGHTGEISTMVLVPDVVDAVGAHVPVLAAGGIGCGRQMAAALALGAQGAWTGSIWLTVAESETEPWVIESLLAAGPRDAVRSRAMTGKPARQLRTAWTEAWERPDAPKPLPMPLQGILYAEMATRFVRARNRALSGSPVGQIVSRMDSVRPSREVVREMVEECVATMERLNGLLAAAEKA